MNRSRFLSALASLVLVVAASVASAGVSDRLVRLTSGVDPDYVTTGILYDRVVPMSGIDRFDGSAGAPPAGAAVFRQAYHEIRRSFLDTPSWPPASRLRDEAAGLRPGEPIPIGVLDVSYQRLAGDAVSSGKAWVEGGVLHVSGAGALVERRAFMAAPLVGRTFRGASVSFVVDPQRYFRHATAPPQRLAVDFDDGRGYRAVTAGETVAVSYAVPGTKTVRVRRSDADGNELDARFRFDVQALAVPLPDDTIAVAGTVPYNGGTATGDAFVYLADGHTAVTRPVVILEGFDLDNSLNWDELYALLNDENLLEDLRASGYDAVVLNFDDATDYIQRNALLTVELIEQVQAMILPQQQFPLVGASMGGLVGRYALAWMETNAVAHRVATFMTFDTPHRGANIPLGIQYWLDFFSDASTDAAFLLSRLDTPAARQMLVYHHTTPPGATGEADPLRAQFVADLAAAGDYPANPRLLAVANGSAAMADQGFAAGDQIIEWEANIALAAVTGNVWAVPDGGSTQIFDGVYFVLFGANESLDVIVSSTLPYDNAPGGSRNSMAQMDSVDAPLGDIVALHDSHCFIPTVSALDVDTGDLFHDVAGDPALLSKTPFDAVYFPLVNQPHVDVTPANAVWIRSGILGTPTAVRPATAAATPHLEQNYPNPFNPTTHIRFSMPAPGPFRLTVHDAAGRRVRTLRDGVAPAGWHDARWDGRDDAGRRVASGVYFYRLEAPGGTQARKMLLLK
jgi:hypothetical protein